jgi:hypothetical protein
MRASPAGQLPPGRDYFRRDAADAAKPACGALLALGAGAR